MFINFEGKDNSFGNVSFSWLVKNGGNEYRISKEYIGGEDEDGNENLICSWGCTISIMEIKSKSPDILKSIIEQAQKDLSIEFSHDSIMNEYSYQDFDSFDNSEIIFHTLLNITFNTLLSNAFKEV